MVFPPCAAIARWATIRGTLYRLRRLGSCNLFFRYSLHNRKTRLVPPCKGADSRLGRVAWGATTRTVRRLSKILATRRSVGCHFGSEYCSGTWASAFNLRKLPGQRRTLRQAALPGFPWLREGGVGRPSSYVGAGTPRERRPRTLSIDKNSDIRSFLATLPY